MLDAFSFLDVALAIVVVALVRVMMSRSKRRAPHPLGPRGLPFIGNVLQMPKVHEWLTFADWGERYCDIVHITLLGQPIVILNSAKDAVALLDKRSNIYSDRPVLTMGGELVGWKNVMGLTPYGEQFREYRRLTARFIGSKAQMERHLGLVEYETKIFLGRLLKDPEDVAKNIRKTAGAIILKLSYGYEILEDEDPLVELVDRAMKQLSEVTTPGAFIVDVFPLLQYLPAWLPGTGFRKLAREWKHTLQQMADVPHQFVKRQMANDEDIPNFTSDLLRNEKLDDRQEFNIKYSAASLYAGGADTTVSAVYTFFLVMTLFPHVQKRAQAEIDSVVGRDRLPSFEDRSNLPYVEGVFKEVLRWHPVGPLSLPHRLMQDDMYEGYLLPKGALVIANIWKFLHDPDVYPNPSEFDPTRHLEEGDRALPPDPRNYCFGFGRRICPGLHLADASVWASCAMTLAAFDIDKVIHDGKVIEVVPEYTSGTISHPKPFKCSIRPRSLEALALFLSNNERLSD